MDFAGIIVALVVGLVFGAVGVWLLLVRGKDSELALVREKMEGLQAEKTEALGRAGSAEGELGALRGNLEDAKANLVVVQGRLDAVSEELTREKVAHGQLRAELEEKSAEMVRREEKLKEDEVRLKDVFENLSNKALGESMEKFVKQSDELLKQYREAAKGDTNEKRQEIEKLLGPMKETLVKLEENNRVIEKEREGSYRELRQQIEELSGGTRKLIGALQGSATAGRFGEAVLQRIVELAGLQDRVMSFAQETIQGEDGKLRPDMIIQLPGGRCLVIDAKAPIHELESEERSYEDQKLLAKAVAGKVLDYAKSLNRKDYVKMDEAPDFTIMFVPSESSFRAACEGRPDLIEAAMAHNVVIASPSTLLALLRAVEYGWKQEKLASEAREVQIHAKKLYKGLCTMMGFYETLGKRIKDVGKAYNSFGGSLDSTVMPAARTFDQAGIGFADELPERVVVEFEERDLRARDFSALPGLED